MTKVLSLRDQLEEVLRLATEARMYDAADWIRKTYVNFACRCPQCVPPQPSTGRPMHRHDAELVLVLAKALAQYHYCLDWDMAGFDKNKMLEEANLILDTLAQEGIEIPGVTDAD